MFIQRLLVGLFSDGLVSRGSTIRGYSQNLYLSVRAEGAYCCGLVSEIILCLRFGGLIDCFKVLRMLKYDYFLPRNPHNPTGLFFRGGGEGVIFGRVFESKIWEAWFQEH